jgi:serine/threonine protein kinase
MSIKSTTTNSYEQINSITPEDWYNRILESKDNQYHILKHLSTSGKGEFFLAMTSENYLVSLKIFMDKKELENEVENLKYVHRKIEDTFLPYLDYFIISLDEDKYYIMVMKYFEGWILLSDYINKHLFYDDQKIQIKSKLDLIIYKLHRLSIAHNDLDATKVLIHSKNGNIRLMDLGFCVTRFGMNLSEEEFEKTKLKDLEMLKMF